MLTLTLKEELAPRQYVDVLCNGKPFCQMYMNRHGDTQLVDPGNMVPPLWVLFTKLVDDHGCNGDYPEETLEIAQETLNDALNLLNLSAFPADDQEDQQKVDSPEFGIKATLAFSVDTQPDQAILDYLGQGLEQAFQRMEADGLVTPDDHPEEPTIKLLGLSCDAL